MFLLIFISKITFGKVFVDNRKLILGNHMVKVHIKADISQ